MVKDENLLHENENDNALNRKKSVMESDSKEEDDNNYESIDGKITKMKSISKDFNSMVKGGDFIDNNQIDFLETNYQSVKKVSVMLDFET